MRNIHTGKIAVYDADLIEGGRWEAYSPEAESAKAETPKAASTKAKTPKPFDQDFIAAQDEVTITLTDASGKTTENPQA
jgi:hypothetical protein